MPEFCTWWIESGPITCTDSSSASVLVTTCFVTWSATTAATATAARPAHCHAPAPSERSATETGASPFVDEPTRTSRCSTVAQPSAALVVDAEARPWDRGQALLADRLAAELAGAVGAVVDALQRGVDLVERLLRALLEALVELAVVRDGRHVGEVVVVAAAADLAELVLDAARVLLVQEGDRAVQPGALGLAAASGTRPCRCASLWSPFPRRSPPRAAARSRPGRCRPARPSCPATCARRRSRRPARGSASVSASSRTTAAFALPSSGAWVDAHLPGSAVPADDPGRGSAGRDPQLQARAHSESVARTPARPTPRRSCGPGSGCRRPPALLRRTERAAAAARRPPAARRARPLGCGATSGWIAAWNSRVSSRFGHSSSASPASVDGRQLLLRLLDHPERGAQQRLDPAHLGEQPLALALRAARDRARLGVRLGDDQLRLALRLVSRVGRRVLGGDERRREQLLALLDVGRALLEVLDLVGELAALAPDLLEAVGDVLQQLLDVVRACSRTGCGRRVTCLSSTGV